MIRRNDELALLYEKLRILDSALKKGEIQYNNRLDDIRVLRVKLKVFTASSIIKPQLIKPYIIKVLNY